MNVKSTAAKTASLLLIAIFSFMITASAPVEKWGVFELELQGTSKGNPFVDVGLTATFSCAGESLKVTGFYDGNGVYRARFMPGRTGVWRYETQSNCGELAGKRGEFIVVPPSPRNHGPVGVRNTFHFAYADSSPFHQVGTTCYSWIHCPDSLQEETLRTLAASPFNKLRMLVLPTDQTVGDKPPLFFPFEGRPPRQWDFARFNPEFFRLLEKRVGQLCDLGVECDLILFHPYGRNWGFDAMDSESDDRYLRYVVARLAAYRNVWWSIANEFDFLKTKSESDWDRFFHVVGQSDPYGRLRSIHNGYLIYNHTRPWVTHASIQNGSAVEEAGRAQLYRDVYRKPIVYDEVKYEGDIDRRWGRLSAQELVHRFWSGLVAGTYVGHGECFKRPDGITWLSHGGKLRGQSPPRLAFLRKIMEEGPDGIDPIDKWQDPRIGGKPGEYYLVYFGRESPTSWPFQLYKNGMRDGLAFQVERIDTWNMTVEPVDGVFVARKKDIYHFIDEKERAVPMPGKPYMALRIRRVGGQPVPADQEPPDG